MKVITLSGSLRAASSNKAMLLAAKYLAPAGMELVHYDDLDQIPAFNPDLDQEGLDCPPEVKNFREQLQAADAVIISSPEYANGLPGSLKNAFDGVVSTTILSDKPILVMTASSSASGKARAQLMDSLGMIEARLLEGQNFSMGDLRHALDGEGILKESEISQLLTQDLQRLAELIQTP